MGFKNNIFFVATFILVLCAGMLMPVSFAYGSCVYEIKIYVPVPDSLVNADSVAVDSNISVVEDADSVFYVDSVSILLVDSLINYARCYIGAKYASSGNGPKTFDCSGFTTFVFRHFGYELYRTSSGQVANGWKIISNQDDLQRGDLVFFNGRKIGNSIGHVGILVDNDIENHVFTFIHASVARGVIISYSNEQYYKVRYVKGCRVIK